MTREPLSAPARTEDPDLTLEHARNQLERLGYELIEQQRDRRSESRLLIARSETRRELVFCELRAERLSDQDWPGGDLRRGRLRRAALAWLGANPAVEADTLRFDRLTVFVGHDGTPVGLEHQPQAF